jgi:hypothetical protein
MGALSTVLTDFQPSLAGCNLCITDILEND